MSSVVLEMSPHLPPSNIVWLRRGRLCKSNIWEDPIFLCLKSVCFDSIFKGCWWNLICTKLLSGTQISCSLFFLPQTKKMIIGLHAKCFKRYTYTVKRHVEHILLFSLLFCVAVSSPQMKFENNKISQTFSLYCVPLHLLSSFFVNLEA